MFIGQITSQNNFHVNFFTKQQQTTTKLQKSINQSKVQNNRDNFTRSYGHTIQYSETYKGVNRLTPLTKEPISYTQAIPSEDLTKDLYSLCNKDYTEKDALVYQYYKKNCYQYWNVTSDKYIMTGEETEEEIKNYTSKIVEIGMNQFRREELKKTITDEELEKFRQELVQNGVDNDIDWWEIRSDNNYCTMGSNPKTLEKDIDYMCSQYAVLKNRIESQYTGEQKEENMQILNDIYQYRKESFINYYADSVGGFFENLGASGISEDIKSSLNVIIEQKITEYENYIAQNNNYASITNKEDTWLYQDNAFMAAQLRKSVYADKGITEKSDSKERYEYYGSEFDFSQRLQYNLENNMTDSKEIYTNAVYSLKDLQFAKIYADTMSSYMNDYQYSYRKHDDAELGKEFTQHFYDINHMISDNNIHQNLKQAVQKTTKTFVNKVIDTIDKRIEKNRQKPVYGDRLSYIDRNVVFREMNC